MLLELLKAHPAPLCMGELQWETFLSKLDRILELNKFKI